MVKTHSRSRRTKTGSLVKTFRTRRKYELGRPAIETKLGSEKKKVIRTRGGNEKIKMFSGDTVNVVDPKTNTCKNVPINGVETNIASIDYKRRSIITKGAILETELGYVRVTSRPGQDGQINGVIDTDYKPKK